MSIESQGHFLKLVQGHLHMKFKTCFFQKPLGHFNQILYVQDFRYKELKICLSDADHLTKMAVTPIYG